MGGQEVDEKGEKAKTSRGPHTLAELWVLKGEHGCTGQTAGGWERGLLGRNTQRSGLFSQNQMRFLGRLLRQAQAFAYHASYLFLFFLFSCFPSFYVSHPAFYSWMRFFFSYTYLEPHLP